MSSATPKEKISTMLETSFLTLSGRTAGRSLPVSFRLHRYMARANSGNRSWPDLVVSDKVQICDRASPGSLERSRRSFALSPDRAWSSPTADLKSCSNLAWSWAVMKDKRMLGILLERGVWAGGAGRVRDEVERKESAIWLEVIPVGWGSWG